MYILFDIGGTKMRVAGSRDLLSYGPLLVEPTPPDFNDAIKLFQWMALDVAGSERIETLAGGVPSPLDRDRNILLSPTNLPLWKGKALRDTLEAIFTCPVHVENDAALVGLGEAARGAGRGYPIVGYITVSTGVGGARIVNGTLDEASSGFEPGRITIDEGHDLESLVSGTSFEKRFGMKPGMVTDEKIWDEMARYLAVGLNDIIALWSPDAIVLGGSMIVRPVGIKVDQVKEHLQKFASRIPHMPDIKQATLADEGGLNGAMTYLAQKLAPR